METEETKAVEAEGTEVAEATKPEPKYLTAKDILEAVDRETVDVEVPEWGGTVRLRPMSGDEAVVFMDSYIGEEDKKSAMRVAACCLVDENDKPLFTTKEQIEKFIKKNLKAIRRLQDIALEINGLSTQDTKVRKD